MMIFPFRHEPRAGTGACPYAHSTGRIAAVEAKFVEDWATSLRNPNSPVGSKPWSVAEQQAMISQATKYSAGFEGGVIYHTNSAQLAAHYTQVFNNAGITNFRFVITPTVKP